MSNDKQIENEIKPVVAKAMQNKESGERKQHFLKKPITQGGVEKAVDQPVLLTDRQADSLRKSGHIV